MSRMNVLVVVFLFFSIHLKAGEAKLLRQPSVSNNMVAFAYANDIWTVDLNGGEARQLTTFRGREFNPVFSPDGKWIAFSGAYDGNVDVYLIPSSGGNIKRLTWHPGADIVRGWTPEGKVLFTSGRESAPISYPKFYTIAPDDAFPKAMPVPRGYRGSFSPDGKQFAYELVSPWDEEWRNYRGGQNKPIWVMNMDSYSITKVPDEKNVRNLFPVWLDNTLYFLSDRDFGMNLYSYSFSDQKLTQLTHYKEYDIKYLSAGGEKLTYTYGGEIYLFDPSTSKSTKVQVSISADFPWMLPHWEKAEKYITSASISPTGVRAVFGARGDIFTVPAEKGDWRNLTSSPGSREREPVWSPDGQTIAWFSDQSGEYKLMIGDQDGLKPPRVITLPEPTFIYTPAWSPDSKYLTYTDANLKLWLVNVESGKVQLIDQDNYIHPERTMDPVWSPDSKWVAYAKRLTNQFHVVMVYSLDENKNYQLTDGMSDAVSPAWDAGGKYMYFLASTNFGLNTGWLDMSSYEKPVERAVYLVVLNSKDKSPLLPESDEEKAKEEEKKPDVEEAKKKNKAKKGEEEDKTDELKVIIDFKDIGQRILSLDIPERDYHGLVAASEGIIFYGESVQNQPGLTLHRYKLKDRKSESYLSPVSFFTVSADGKKLLYESSGQWGIVETSGSPKPGDGKIDVSGLSMKLDLHKEYKQIFDEAWRIQRDYIYVPNLNGANWDSVYKMYEPFVKYINHRADLNYLLDILGGEVSVGHSFVGGGDMPDEGHVSIGLLGADLVPVNNYYQIKKIYTGENWNPDLRAPLSAPGIKVSEGDYILAVDGRKLTTDENPYSYFENMADKQIVLTVNNKPGSEGSWDITVVPVGNESGLRRLNWVEDNRKKVDSLSGGKLAYVWLPNTGGGGYSYFNRWYFSQQNKEGAVIDERFNSGGSAADYMVDIMSRKLYGFFNNRIHPDLPFTTPGAGIWGPKVMIINEMAGSGGDLLPYMFRQMNIGPLVGTRTWGGLVGIWDYPGLIDGGVITAPRGGFYDVNGNWAVEDEGVPPDIRVDMLPQEVNQGKDPQLQRAVEEAMQLLEKNKVKILPEPAPPQRVKRPE